MKGLVLIAALTVLAGCTTPWFTMPPGSKDYRAGYSEGCSAGYTEAGSPVYWFHDPVEPPPKGDPQRVGWLTGFDRCKHSYERIQRFVSLLLGPP